VPKKTKDGQRTFKPTDGVLGGLPEKTKKAVEKKGEKRCNIGGGGANNKRET